MTNSLIKRTMDSFRKWPLFLKVWRSLCRANPLNRKSISNFIPERLFNLDVRQEQDKIHSLTKRALLSYIVHPFSIANDDPRFLQHINIWRVKEIVRLLNQLGYLVDVIDYRDTRFTPHHSYSLFIGHGGINFRMISLQIPDNATKIYLSTGCYWQFHNNQELARFEALRKRRGIDLHPDRFIRNSEDNALFDADGIIGIGNDHTRSTYSDFASVIMINNTAFSEGSTLPTEKDFSKGRNHFLYFAGSGCVHKGLDLLLEAFRELEQHLWICSKIDNAFENAYKNELYNISNIHLYGWIQPHSTKYYELMKKCNYVILPSCSEGQAQSVIECMLHGLIPVVSRPTGIDISDYGVMLEPCSIDIIKEQVIKLVSLSLSQYRRMSRKAQEIIHSDYSEFAFHRNMTDAIKCIANSKIRYQGKQNVH